MTNPDRWRGARYYPISQHYKALFGQRVHKISVSTAKTCPNRDKGNANGCIFCDEWGSTSNPVTHNLPVLDQITQNKSFLESRFKAKKFLVYFQSFTTTYTNISKLADDMSESISISDIKGVIIGTRPDCLPQNAISLFSEFSKTSYLSVELGAQSFSDSAMKFLNRGHSVDQTLDAISVLHDKTKAAIGIHLIFGLPEESDTDIVNTARRINSLPITDVKLHNLHVLKGTGLHQLYIENKFVPIDLEEYSRRVILFLENLSPEIPIQRLAAYAGPHGNLIAPDWTGNRQGPSQYIQNQMEKTDTYQGRLAQRL